MIGDHMNPLLSIIIPCYNTGKYIEKCLESVLSQNYKDIEVIVVDDGSIDDTGDIVRVISKQDKRVRYVYKKNSGVSETRNRGLREATGDYVTFVDSDDTVEPQIYETLMSFLLKNSADISHCSYSRVNKQGVTNIGNTGKIYEMDIKDSVDKLLNGGLFTGSVCNKIYKKSIVENVYFDAKYKINEDVLFNFYAFLNSKKIIYIDKCYYNYQDSDTSSCISTDIIKKAEDCYYVSKEIYIKCLEVGYSDIGYQRVANSRINLYRSYKFYGNTNKKSLCRELREEIIDDYNNKKLFRTQRINGMLIKWFDFCYKPIYLLYNKVRKPNWDV